ncbi:MAG: UvrABC system protein C [Phycisphaerae bacterium]|nr:UvrABC system protein C [Phycisphaerae bacterium]
MPAETDWRLLLPRHHTGNAASAADGAAARAAVYVLLDEHDRPIQLALTHDLRRLLRSRLAQADAEPQRRRVELGAIVRGVRWCECATGLEARWRYLQIARLMYPRLYRRQLPFGPAWFLHVDWSERVPDIRATDRVWQGSGEWLGPWSDRATCQRAVEGLWDLFDLCRYPNEVRRYPEGKRCQYAEMGRCDAPCDGSAEIRHYHDRCRAAWAFAGGNGENADGRRAIIGRWIERATDAMRRAADERRFERAAQIRSQIQFAETWKRGWAALPTREQALRMVLALPVPRRRQWQICRFDRGRFDVGGAVKTGELARAIATGAADIDASAGGEAAPRTAPPEATNDSAEARMEATWLLSHFLNHSEAGAAIVAWLSERPANGDWSGLVERRLSGIRARPPAPLV